MQFFLVCLNHCVCSTARLKAIAQRQAALHSNVRAQTVQLDASKVSLQSTQASVSTLKQTEVRVADRLHKAEAMVAEQRSLARNLREGVVAHLEQEEERLQQQVPVLQHQLATKTKELHKLRNTAKTTREQLVTAEARRVQVQHDTDQMEQRKALLQSEVEQLEPHVERLRNQRQEEQQQLAILKSEVLRAQWTTSQLKQVQRNI